MTCEACHQAKTNPRTGMYQANCHECTARALANSPQYFDAMKAEAITPAYRSALQAAFGADWKQGHENVKQWAQKIKASHQCKAKELERGN